MQSLLALLGVAPLALILYGVVFNDRVHDFVRPSSVLAGVLLGGLSGLAFVTLFASRRNALLGKLWLAIGSVSLTWLSIDLLVGFLWIEPLSPSWIPDRWLHHRPIPGSVSVLSGARFRKPEFRYRVRINDVGLRGGEVDVEKAAGTFRIVMLGDSFTLGKGVQGDETFSARLEQSLRSRGVAVEVLNAGVDSYAPLLARLRLERNLVRLGPDLVVLHFDMSDLVQEEAYRNEASWGADAEFLGFPGRDPDHVGILESARSWIDAKLFVTRLLIHHLDRALEREHGTVRSVVRMRDPDLLAHTLAGDDVDRSGQWRGVFESILGIEHFCAERGIAFLLVVYPWGHQVDAREWVPGRFEFVPEGAVLDDASIRTLERFASKHGIELLNTFPAFRIHTGAERLYWRYDMHWTPHGHRLMAVELERRLRERYGL